MGALPYQIQDLQDFGDEGKHSFVHIEPALSAVKLVLMIPVMIALMITDTNMRANIGACISTPLYECLY